MRRRSSLALAAALLALAGCGRKPGAAGDAGAAGEDRAIVTLESVEARASASALSPAVRGLARGTELKVLDAREGFYRVQLSGGAEAWVEAGSFERLRDREEREKRAAAVQAFAEQPGRALENAPILLAPAYGSARWGEVEDGDDVEVVLHDHDFYGIRLPDAKLAFVPARSVRLLPSEVAGGTDVPQPRRQIVPRVTTPGDPGVVGAADAPPIETPAPSAEAPLEALPPGAEPPSLVVRAEPAYPESARRMGLGGEVVLRIVVTAEGTVGKVDVVTGAPGGLTEAAVDAVARWRYRPARVGDRPVPVVKVVRVRFAPGR